MRSKFLRAKTPNNEIFSLDAFVSVTLAAGAHCLGMGVIGQEDEFLYVTIVIVKSWMHRGASHSSTSKHYVIDK